MITLTSDEAKEVLKTILAKQYQNIDTLPEKTRLEAIVGIVSIVDVLQTLGYRVTRPLKAL